VHGFITDNIMLNSNYGQWRRNGLYSPYPIRYPNGKLGAKECYCAFKEKEPILITDTNDEVIRKLDLTPLNYIESRKKIYTPEYIRLVREQPLYQELLYKVNNGHNIIIAEVDGPHEESLQYYMKTYNVSNNIIVNNTMEATKE